MAEVIKVVGNIAYAQVFESTRGLKVSFEVQFTGNMLEIELGPGLLSKNYDGLQNDLDKKEGIFLKKGEAGKSAIPNKASPNSSSLKPPFGSKKFTMTVTGGF